MTSSQPRSLQSQEYDAASRLLASHLPRAPLEPYLGPSSQLAGVFDQDSLVACLHWRIVEASWRGQPIQLAQVGPGATKPGHRGHGNMRQLVLTVLTDLRENGVLFAGQETPIIGFHRRTGWEVATFAQRHRATAATILSEPVTDGYQCRPATVADAEIIAAKWPLAGLGSTFTSQRDISSWQHLLTSPDDWWIGLRNGEPEGYARVPAPEAKPDERLLVTELTTDRISAALALLRALLGATGSASIEWWTAVDRLPYFGFTDPRQVAISVEPDKLLRIVDAGAVLRRLAGDPIGEQSNLVRITDSLCPWNDRVFDVVSGKAVTEPRTGTAQISLSIRGLAALAAGVIDFGSLARAGLAQRLLDVAPDSGSCREPWFPDDL